MKRPFPHRQYGHGWFEFSLAAMLLAVLAALLLAALLHTEELAEKTAVDITLRNLRSELRWHTARALLENRQRDIAALAGANPVPWLAQPPPGYAGERALPGADLAAGSWYFDPLTRELVYLPRFTRHLFASGEPPRLAWRVRPLKSAEGADVNAPVPGLVLVETRPYRWF